MFSIPIILYGRKKSNIKFWAKSKSEAEASDVFAFQVRKSDSAGNFTGAQAASASVYSAGRAVNNSLYAFYVRFPGPV